MDFEKLGWERKRWVILFRDGFRCQKCKSRGLMTLVTHKGADLQKWESPKGLFCHLTIHHIKGKEEEGVYLNKPENLTSLCYDCHKKVNSGFFGKAPTFKAKKVTSELMEKALRDLRERKEYHRNWRCRRMKWSLRGSNFIVERHQTENPRFS